VDLVDEEDDLPLRGGHLLQDGLQPVLEFAAVFRPGDERADVEADHPLVLEVFRHVAVDDPLREPLDDRRLSDPGLPDQHGVVFRPAREHLHHPADLLVPADHRIERPVPRQLVEVAGVAFQGLVLLLRVRIGDALVPADLDENLEDGVLRDPVGGEDFRQRALLFIGHRDEDVLRADILVRQPGRLGERGVEDAVESGRHIRLAGDALDLRQFFERAAHLPLDLPRVGAELLQDGRDDALRLLQKRDEQVFQVQRLVAELPRQPLRVLERLLDL